VPLQQASGNIINKTFADSEWKNVDFQPETGCTYPARNIQSDTEFCQMDFC